MNFWKVVKEVSTQPLRQEAERPYLLGIAGSPSFVTAVVDELVGPGATPQERAMAEARLVRAPAPAGVEGAAALSRCDLVLAGEDSPEAARIIQNFSKVNAEYALVSAVPQAIPGLAPLFPVAVPMDIVILTKNQVMMVLRLAAAFGRTPEPRARLREIGPVIGTAFGWRALARELAGL